MFEHFKQRPSKLKKSYSQDLVKQTVDYRYTHRQMNLYRMFFADFSVNSHPIFMKFCMDYLRVTRRLDLDPLP